MLQFLGLASLTEHLFLTTYEPVLILYPAWLEFYSAFVLLFFLFSFLFFLLFSLARFVCLSRMDPTHPTSTRALTCFHNTLIIIGLRSYGDMSSG